MKQHMRGFSLMEMMVALGIMSIMGLGFATYINNQIKAQSYGQLVQEGSNFGISLQSQITSSICTQNTSAGVTPNISLGGFDPAPLNANQPVIIQVAQLNGLLTGPPVTYPVIVQAGSTVPTMSNSLTVQRMQIVISKNPTVQNTYVGEFQILMSVQNPATAMGPPVIKTSIPITLNTNGQTAPVLVTGCQFGGPSAGLVNAQTVAQQLSALTCAPTTVTVPLSSPGIMYVYSSTNPFAKPTPTSIPGCVATLNLPLGNPGDNYVLGWNHGMPANAGTSYSNNPSASQCNSYFPNVPNSFVSGPGAIWQTQAGVCNINGITGNVYHVKHVAGQGNICTTININPIGYCTGTAVCTMGNWVVSSGSFNCNIF